MKTVADLMYELVDLLKANGYEDSDHIAMMLIHTARVVCESNGVPWDETVKNANEALARMRAASDRKASHGKSN